MLSEQQLKQIKEQLISQIKSTFPEDKRDSAISQIEEMNNEQLEEFLIQNNMIKASSGIGTTPKAETQKTQQCIFCSIAEGSIQSYKIDENKDAIAVLEINPISYGHTLIIPKKHIDNSEKIPKTVFSLAKKLSKKLKTILKPKEIKIQSSSFMNHEILNILPIYKNETLKSERKQASPEELNKLKETLETKPKEKKKIIRLKKQPIEIKEEKLWLPKRIP